MAVSEQTLETVRVRRVRRPGRRALLFVLTTFIGLGLAIGGLFLLHERWASRILPGISAGGIELAGLNADEARAALTARYADVSGGKLTIRSSIGSTTIAFADVHRQADIDTMIAAALARGRGGSWLDETVAGVRLLLDPEQVDMRVTYDQGAAARLVDAFADRMALSAIDATVGRSAAGFAAINGAEGRRIETAAVLAGTQALFADAATPTDARIDAPVERVAPSLTTEEAAGAKVAADRMAASLKVAIGKSTWTIGAKTIRAWISFEAADGGVRPVIDRTKIPAALKKVAAAVSRPVRDAEFLRDKHGRIVGSMADRAGRKLDRVASTTLIGDALEARASAGTSSPGPLKLVVATIAPKRTTEEAARTAPLMTLVGSWTTYYQVAAHNGFGANITVPTRVLNGTVVAPGAVFDFWAGLGEVSLRTGYRLGGAIVGGHSVEGKALAGGICAASTTLFNAALRGGFEILQRQPHWYYITRYPLGLDATVSGSQTMRFRNDTKYPILIRGFASPGVVRYEIWSVPNGRSVALSRPQVSNVVAGSDSRVDAPDLPKGTSERIEWPVDGKDVVVTRTVRDAAGRVIHHDTFVSHYHRMIGINRIGIG